MEFALQSGHTVKHFLFAGILCSHRDAKIKSWPIIPYVRIIEEDASNRENKVS